MTKDERLRRLYGESSVRADPLSLVAHEFPSAFFSYPNEYAMADKIVDKAFSEVVAWGTVYTMDAINTSNIKLL